MTQKDQVAELKRKLVLLFLAISLSCPAQPGFESVSVTNLGTGEQRITLTMTNMLTGTNYTLLTGPALGFLIIPIPFTATNSTHVEVRETAETVSARFFLIRQD